MVCSQHCTLSVTATWPGELTSPFRMPKKWFLALVRMEKSFSINAECFLIQIPQMNFTRALSSGGIFSHSSLHKHCCCFRIREFPQATISCISAFYFTTYLSVRIFVHRWWTFSFRKRKQQRVVILFKQNEKIFRKIFKCKNKIVQCAYFKC